MALTIENGTGVADANSYVTVAEARAYATARGVTLATNDSAGDLLVEIMAIKAMDYLNTLNYRGFPVATDQALPWPRNDVWIDYAELPDDQIPARLKNAQKQLIIEVAAGVLLLPTTSTQTSFVKREKIGPLETEYSEAFALRGSAAPYMPLVTAYLGALLGGFQGGLRTVRV